jgi:DNA ligase-1
MHDDEAVVIKHVLGTGRCANMMGAIICKNEFGIVFKIGSGFNDH